MSDLLHTAPPTLPEIRAQRADAEEQYQQAMRKLSASNASEEDLAAALGYHREVFALYAAELSLIESGKLPPSQPTA